MHKLAFDIEAVLKFRDPRELTGAEMFQARTCTPTEWRR